MQSSTLMIKSRASPRLNSWELNLHILALHEGYSMLILHMHVHVCVILPEFEGEQVLVLCVQVLFVFS